jgi:tetratricopeptide (TPR) repeat protein
MTAQKSGRQRAKPRKAQQRPVRIPRQLLITSIISFLLAVLVWISFSPTLGGGFLNYDDNEYVYDNPHITGGLSLAGIAWAFTHFHAYNWHPVTTILHMLDCQVYGLAPWGHHSTNILLHTGAAMLLFLALYALTRNTSPDGIWCSAFVAALFAIHPLHVESVAWISERKDVLSGVFFSATLLSYARYAQGERRSLEKYSLVVLFFALGLMSKPTLVTVPLLLLLLDYWPLRRMQSIIGEEDEGGERSVQNLIAEKVPLFVLSAAACVITMNAQKTAFTVTELLPFQARFANAVVSYVAYLVQLAYPARLAVLYPYPEAGIGGVDIVGALLLLWAVAIAALVWRKKFPYLLTGWFWFVGMLVPMIGLVQVGPQARADRYTYLPAIGVFIIFAWGAADLSHRFHFGRRVLTAVAVLIIGLLAVRTYNQTSYWHDSERLWRHATDVTTDNHIAHHSLGNALLEQGRLDEAIVEYRKSLAIRPDRAAVESNLGNALLRLGRVDEAMPHLQQAIESDPNYAEAYNDMGGAWMTKGEPGRAIGYYQKAVQLKNSYADAENNLGAALLENGQVDDAIAHYQKALKIKPLAAEVQCNLGNAFARKNDWNNALDAYQTAVRERPDYAKAHNNLGVAWEALGKLDEALAEFRETIRINPGYAEAHCNVGEVLAQRGHRDEAIAQLTEALRLKPNYEEARQKLRELGAL